MSLPIFNFTKIESTNDFARSLITEHKIFKGIVIAIIKQKVVADMEINGVLQTATYILLFSFQF